MSDETPAPGVTRRGAPKRDQPGVTRRGALKRGLLGGALLAVGGAGWLAARGGPLAPVIPEGLRVLDARSYSVLNAAVYRLIPDPVASEPARAAVAEVIDGVMARSSGREQAEFVQLLGLIENGLAGLLFDGQSAPFTARSPADQDATLEGWRHSRIAIRRTGYQALKGIVVASYYGDARTHAGLGYPGPPRHLR